MESKLLKDIIGDGWKYEWFDCEICGTPFGAREDFATELRQHKEVREGFKIQCPDCEVEPWKAEDFNRVVAVDVVTISHGAELLIGDEEKARLEKKTARVKKEGHMYER